MAKLENRYANALLELSEERGSLETDLEQALFIRDTLDSDDILAFLTHPHIPKSDKYTLFHESFSGKVGGDFLGFLHLMVRKNRASLILAVLAEYIDHANRRLGRIEAKIVSARALTEAQIEAIRAIMAKNLNMQVRIRAAVDPDVIGGFYILADGHIFDATVRSELNKMKERLKKGGHYAS